MGESIKQRVALSTLLQNLGRTSFAEIEKVMQEREVTEPEAGLFPEVDKRLQDRISAKFKQSAVR